MAHLPEVAIRAVESLTHSPSEEVDSFPVPAETAAKSHCDDEKYLEMYQASVDDPSAFWGEHGKRLEWMKSFTKVMDINYNIPNVSIKWYEDGTLNASVNCIDRHLQSRGDQVAIIWEGDEPTDDKKITYM